MLRKPLPLLAALFVLAVALFALPSASAVAKQHRAAGKSERHAVAKRGHHAAAKRGRHAAAKRRRHAKRRHLRLISRNRPKLSVLTLSPANGSTLSGLVDWRAETVDAVPTKVSFAVDGTVLSTVTAPPYAYEGTGSLDTTTLANGSHTLTVTAYAKRGVSAASSVNVRVDNPALAPSPPSEPTEPAPSPEPTPETASTSSGGPIYWGAWIGNQLTGEEAPWDMNAVSQFESSVGKPLSMVHFSSPFANCFSSPCRFYGFPTSSFEDVRKAGAIPFFSWASQSIPSSKSEPEYQLSDVISGKYDSYIRSFASSAKSWGHPFFLRFNWEMNGNWFPWSEGVNGNNPGEYVAAWRHVHDLFTAVGATNATWVWCPNIDPDHRFQGLASLYPGDAYVDWTCLDGYNQGTMPSKPDRWRTFDELFSSTYKQVVTEVAPSKPMALGEVASTEYGGSKATWIREMLQQLPSSYPSIRALLWFDKWTDGDWPLDSSAAATEAFADGIQSTSYTTDAFSSLSAAGAIQPLS
jgi:hypothetical protein